MSVHKGAGTEMNDILICLDCPIENGCVDDEEYEGKKSDCPLEKVDSNNTYVTIKELAVILGIPHSTIYSRRRKLEKLARHKMAKSPKNRKSTFYIHREDAIVALGEMKAIKKKRERKAQIVFSIKLEARNKLKEIAREKNMSLSGLVNEIVTEYLQK